MAARKGARLSKPVPVRRSPTPRGLERESSGQTRPHPRPNLAPAVELDTMRYARSLVRDIPDHPAPGILFRDITPLLADPKAFHIVLDAIAERFVGEHVDAVVGIEARGFIFGGALAARLNTSFIPVRKPGKLPYRTEKVAYSLEYGEAELEMHRDSLPEGASVLIVDDLLATGGTAAAAAELVHREGGHVAAYAFVLELESLGGRQSIKKEPVVSVLKYQ